MHSAAGFQRNTTYRAWHCLLLKLKLSFLCLRAIIWWIQIFGALILQTVSEWIVYELMIEHCCCFLIETSTTAVQRYIELTGFYVEVVFLMLCVLLMNMMAWPRDTRKTFLCATVIYLHYVKHMYSLHSRGLAGNWNVHNSEQLTLAGSVLSHLHENTTKDILHLHKSTSTAVWKSDVHNSVSQYSG